MSDSEKKSLLKHHPIQLEFINIVELSIRINAPIDKDDEISDEAVNISHGHTKYDSENKIIQAGLILEVGLEDSGEEAPFSMRVELFGNFSVDDSQFNPEYVEDWAKKNSLYILMPYLREQVYALSTRCEIPPVILPLVQVPSFEVKRPQNDI